MGNHKKYTLKKRRFSNIIISALLSLMVFFGAVTIWGNITLDIEYIDLTNDKFAEELDGYKIAHISDYHNTKNDFLNDAVISTLNEAKPDIILITGDLVDCRKTDIAKGLEFASTVSDIAPVYYVTGNHECNISIDDQQAFDDMIADLKASGVVVLKNEKSVIMLGNGDSINLYGINDPYFHCGNFTEIKETTDELCSSFEINKKEINFLLAHHPEQLDVYSKYGFDYVYSGHAHGGQARLFGVGLIAPDQGIFPKYTSGTYTEASTTLIVSRGIGNSIAPVRFFDRPHLIITTIKTTHSAD